MKKKMKKREKEGLGTKRVKEKYKEKKNRRRI